jgi:hypothetical protein
MNRILRWCVIGVVCAVAAVWVVATVRGPASAPAPGSVEEIRALLEAAIAIKDDPAKAQALMVQAGELAAKLPPGTDVKRLAVEIDPTKVKLDHLMIPTGKNTFEEKTSLSANIELSERFVFSSYPFVGMGENGKGFIFPLPVTDKVRRAQNLMRNGKSIFRIDVDLEPGVRYRKFFVSPDEKYVVLQDWLTAKNLEVLAVDSGKTVTVESPEINGHDYVEPFRFLRWNQDSRAFVVEVTGAYVKGPDQSLASGQFQASGQFLAYRELWRVEGDTGKPSRLKRQEQPWAEKLKWED